MYHYFTSKEPLSGASPFFSAPPSKTFAQGAPIQDDKASNLNPKQTNNEAAKQTGAEKAATTNRNLRNQGVNDERRNADGSVTFTGAKF